MNLQELTDPFFQYICRLNRMARAATAAAQQEQHDQAGAAAAVPGLSEGQARAEILGMLKSMKQRSTSTSGLTDQYNRVEKTLKAFADSSIKHSRLSFAGPWRELSYEEGNLAYEDAFFDDMKETLRDSSKDGTDRLSIYYTCMGLGFTGRYADEPEVLRQKMREIHARLQEQYDDRDEARICADAYDRVDRRNLVEPPGFKLIGIAIALVGCILIVLSAYIYQYYYASHQLESHLKDVMRVE